MWGGGKEKPFEYSELQRSRLGADKTGLSDRKVPQQPNVYFDSECKVSRYVQLTVFFNFAQCVRIYVFLVHVCCLTW